MAASEGRGDDARGGPQALSRAPVEAAALGRIEVIAGPMFSGKTEELIHRLDRASASGQRVLCFKPDLDTRYGRTVIASHSALTHQACSVSDVQALRAELSPRRSEVDVIGIDEAQFFAPALVSLVTELARGSRRVILAGLDLTFAGEPFGPLPALMAIADNVLKLSAVCAVCGQPAVHTQRLGPSRELILVGATGAYEARCRVHFDPAGDRRASRGSEPA